MKICSIENCKNSVWGNDLCKIHTLRKKLASNTTLKKSKLKVNSNKKKENVENIQQMQQFFLSIWNKRKHYSEISNTYLGNEPLSTFFHHILLKSVVPEAKFDETNIILLTPIEHANCHSDCLRYLEINRRREYLLKKYNL